MYYPADLGADISLDSFCAYKDGQLLAMETEWGEDESAVKLYAIDVENEEATELLTLATGENVSAAGLAYRADTDTVYCIMDGEICAMTGMDVSTLQRVSEAPSAISVPPRPSSPETVSTSPPTTRRSSAATPTPRSAPRLASPCRTWVPVPLPTLYYAFGETHGEVEVVLLQRTERRGAGDDEPLDGRGHLLRERRFRGVRRRLFARLHGRTHGERIYLRVP